MDNSNYSKLLQTAINNAREMNMGTKGVLTVEKFILEVLEMLETEDINGELIKCKVLLKKVFESLEDSKDMLSGSINTQNKEDESVKQKEFIELVEALENNPEYQGDEITLDIFLEHVVSKYSKEEDSAGSSKGGIKGDLSDQIERYKSMSFSGKTESDNSQKTESASASDDSSDKNEKPEEEKKNTNKKSAISDVESLKVFVNSVRDRLLESVVGQNHAIDVVTTGIFQGEYIALTDDGSRFKPKATFLFAGPPGVGKSYISKLLGKILNEELGMRFERFDMSVYTNPGMYQSYLNTLESFIHNNPNSVILFDEVEKAPDQIIKYFLQILDNGQASGSHSPSFKDAILIFTTNVGREIYDQPGVIDFSTVPKKTVLSGIGNEHKQWSDEPIFPEALCSRFNTGNVIMFNHLPAHCLRKLIKDKIVKEVEKLKNSQGIDITIDEKVYDSILLAEGGKADARTIEARAVEFFTNEIYELLRFTCMNEGSKLVKNIEIVANIPQDNEKITRLFENSEKTKALVFTDAENLSDFKNLNCKAEFCAYDNVDAAIDSIYQNDYSIAIIDYSAGKKADSKYINDEDVLSEGREFLNKLKEKFPEIPAYIIQNQDDCYDREERLSLERKGVQGFIEHTSNSEFIKTVDDICDNAYRQSIMRELARSNKIVRFETGQLVTAENSARIELFDYSFTSALDAADVSSVLSDSNIPTTQFEDVIGAKSAKEELQFYVNYLKNPKQYIAAEIEPPKGILLYGPPGTGKTMLARALAGEAGVTFIPADGTTFMQKYVGEGKELLKGLFEKARRYSPSILFIDEIDTIAKERNGEHNNSASEEVLNQLLTEMDGFRVDPKRPVLVLAATNYSVERNNDQDGKRALDGAFLRRFDRRVKIDLPDKKDRIKFLNKKTNGKKIFALSDEFIENFANRTTGMSLADMESILKMAKRTAVRTGIMVVDDKMLETTFEEFKDGDERKWSEESVLATARHEAGHAFVSWYCGTNPAYVTVVSRGNYGGYVSYENDELKGTHTKKDLFNRIRSSLAGRAAELVYYGEEEGVTTGPSSDLKHATGLAIYMLCELGMSEKFGLASINPYNQNGGVDPEIREEANKILKTELDKAIELISANRKAIDAIVDALMIHSHLNSKEIDEIFSANATRPE